MKFLIEFHYDSAKRQAFREAIESKGLNRASGVSLGAGWVSTKESVAFLLAEAADIAQVEEACRKWAEFGRWTIHPVIDLEQV